MEILLFLFILVFITVIGNNYDNDNVDHVQTSVAESINYGVVKSQLYEWSKKN